MRVPLFLSFSRFKLLKRKDWKALFKSVLSYFIAITIIFTLSRRHLDDVEEHGSYFSKLQANNYLIQLPISVLLNDPSRSVGAMIQASSIYFVVILSTGLIAYCVAPAILHSPFLVLFFFFIALFLINLLKASYPKLLTSTMNSAMLIIISAVISAYYDKVNGVYQVAHIASQIEIFVLGGLISCAVNFCVFPRWAGDDLRKAMKNGIRAQGKLLAVLSRIVATLAAATTNDQQATTTTEKSAILADLQTAIKESRSTFKEIAALLADSRLEISYSPFDRSYYEAFTVIIRRLLRHLAAIGSSCESLMNMTKNGSINDHHHNHHHQDKSMSCFGQFILDIHDDLILFTNVSMMELRFIYNKFQSRQKHHQEHDGSNAWNPYHQVDDENEDDDGETGSNPWDQVASPKQKHHSALSSPWGSPSGLNSTSSPDKEPILPTATGNNSMSGISGSRKKISMKPFKKAIKAVFAFGAKRGLAFKRKNAQKIEALFPHSYTNEFDGIELPEPAPPQEETVEDDIIPMAVMRETVVPLQNPLPRIPETESRIRSYSSTNAAVLKRNPDLRHSKTYSFTSSYISHTTNNIDVASLRASTNQSAFGGEPVIRNSVKSKSPSMSAYPGWRLSDAIECIKQHQKEVIHAFISESRIINGDGGREAKGISAVDVVDRNRQSNVYFDDNDNGNDNDNATISNVLRFFPSMSPRLGGKVDASKGHHDDSNLLDNMDDLYAIFSFLLCLSNYGDKLDQLGRRSRQMPTTKKLYIPFVWNDPEFGFNSSQCRLQRDESMIDGIDDLKNSQEDLNETSLPEPHFWSEGLATLIKGDGGSFSLWLKKAQSRWTSWVVGKFRSSEYKFAFRVAALVTFGGIFGLLEETREVYHDWRGTWALFTIAVVSSSTVGASTSLGFWRTIGTAIGGFMAFLSWTLFPSLDHLVPHLICALIICVPLTYLRQFTKYQRLGLVMLVAYTIVFFGKYLQELDTAIGTRKGEAEPIFALFYKRTISIVLGVAISLIGTICIFPTFARSVLRLRSARIIQQLCQLYANISVALIGGMSDKGLEGSPKPDLGTSLKQFLTLEFEIQMELIESSDLIGPSSTEFSFEGVEFPSAIYGRLLVQCQNILDGLLSSRLAAMIGFSDAFRTHVLSVAHHERKLVLGSAILFFSVLHGCLGSKAALPPILPDIEKARDMLRRRLRKIPDLLERMLEHGDYHYLFVSACQRETVKRMGETAGIMRELFGVLDKQLKMLDLLEDENKF